MYERIGRYYALFGPTASIATAEERFLAHWTRRRARALDFGAGLCGSALLLSRLGLEVLAFEPSATLATLALDRLSQRCAPHERLTLVEGPPSEFCVPFRADFILLRSVLMLLNDAERATALDAILRHAQPGAQLVVDVRTLHLPWADHGILDEDKQLGHTTYRRRIRYVRTPQKSTVVYWNMQVEQFGRVVSSATEEFTVRADTLESLHALISTHGFEIDEVYGDYDLAHVLSANDPVIVAVAHLK